MASPRTPRRLAQLLVVVAAGGCWTDREATAPEVPEELPPGQLQRISAYVAEDWPEGPAGPGVRIYLEGRLDAAGTAQAHLPPMAGTPERLPALACWVTAGETSPYQVLRTDSASVRVCGLAWHEVADEHLDVYLRSPRFAAGWARAIVLVP